MRVLPDESLPRRLKSELKDHEVSTVPEAGWAGSKNGDLLRLAEHDFDVFVTADRSLQYQQRLEELDLCVVVLVAKSNVISDLLPLAESLRSTVVEANPGEVVLLEV